MTHHRHQFTYYPKCMLAGLFASGSTHTIILPLEVRQIKRILDPLFPKTVKDGLILMKANKQLTLGWVPTLIGYSFHGLGKFGSYEIFKDVYKEILGEQKAAKYYKIGCAISAGLAEVVASYFLCPWDTIRRTIQLSRPGCEYPKSLIPAFNKVVAEQGIQGLYWRFGYLWRTRITRNILEFVSFQWFVQMFYDHIFIKGKENYDNTTQLSITFTSGSLVGIFYTLLTHPAETMISKLYSCNSLSGSFSEKMSKVYKQIGFKGVWAGISMKIIRNFLFTGMQWLIYDSSKKSMGLQTTGGSAKKY